MFLHFSFFSLLFIFFILHFHVSFYFLCYFIFHKIKSYSSFSGEEGGKGMGDGWKYLGYSECHLWTACRPSWPSGPRTRWRIRSRGPCRWTGSPICRSASRWSPRAISGHEPAPASPRYGGQYLLFIIIAVLVPWSCIYYNELPLFYYYSAT